MPHRPPGRPAHWAALALLGLIVVSIGFRSVAAAATEAPQLLCDEFIHAAESRGLWSEGGYSFRGAGAPPHSLLLPILSGPSQIAGATSDVYSAFKAINVLLVSLLAVPVFLLARRLVSPVWALVAAALALAVPGLAFAGLIMTESAFFPAVALAVLLSVRAVEGPSWGRQLLALGSIALAASIRPQGAVLAVALLAAVPLAAAFEARAAGRNPRLRELLGALARFRVSIAVLVAAVLIIPLARVVQGQSARSALGPYQEVLDGPYQPASIAESVGLHAALLPLSAVLVPVTALAIMTVCAWRAGGTRHAAERAFIAVALTSLIATFAVTASFAAAFTDGRISERYAFSLTPVLMIALVLWLDRGMPRPRGTTAVAAAVPVVLIAGIPFERYLTRGVPLDTPSAMPLRWTADAIGLGSVGIAALFIGAGALIALLAAVAPRRVARIALPAIVGATLVAGSVAVSDTIQSQSEFHRSLAGPDPTWIDDAVGRDGRATFLDVTEAGRIPDLERGSVALQAEFWNRSVRTMALSGASPCALPFDQAFIGESGDVDVDGGFADHVVTYRDYLLAGERLRVAGQLALTRVARPLRVLARTEEVEPDGWFGDQAIIRVLRGRVAGAERVVLTLDRPAWTGRAEPTPVTVSVTPDTGSAQDAMVAVRSTEVPAGGRRTVAVPLPQGPSTVRVASGAAFTLEDLGLDAPQPGRRFGARMAVEVVGA